MLASLASSVPATSTAANKFDPMTAAATSLHSKHAKLEHRQMFGSEANNGQHNEGNLLELGLSKLMEAISIPKKVIGSLVNKLGGFLKTVDLKKLIKIALVGGAVILLGAVAAAGVAGISAVVAMVSSALPYYRFFFGGHNKGDVTESEVDVISEFVLDAFNKYDSQYKA